VAASATFTAEATRSSLSATSEPQKTESTSATDDPSPPDNTSVVILPMVSSGDSTPGEQSSQESNKPIPAFVFPLVVVLLFVIIYLSTRWSLKKPQDEIQPK
jgi:cobalamin biosynthesis Mg chelatase CobN